MSCVAWITFHRTRIEQSWNRSGSQKDLRPELSPVSPSSRKIYACMTIHEENEDEGAREIRENRQTDDCETQKLEIGTPSDIVH